MTVNAVVATAENFLKEVIETSSTTPVLVDFWAEWCGPCKQLMPILERLADEYDGRFVLAKVNADEQQALAGQIGVRSLPTVVLFKDGQVADHFVGVVPEAQVRQLLDRHVPPATKSPVQQAREHKNSGDYAAAKLLLEQSLANDANSVELQSELGEVSALQGDLDAARALLTGLQAREPTAAPVKRLTAFLEFSDTLRAHPDAQSLKQQVVDDPVNLEARHALAVHRLLGGEYDAAIDDWLEIMRKDRKFQDDLARKSLVQAFELIGNTDPRVAQARRAMARMIF